MPIKSLKTDDFATTLANSKNSFSQSLENTYLKLEHNDHAPAQKLPAFMSNAFKEISILIQQHASDISSDDGMAAPADDQPDGSRVNDHTSSTRVHGQSLRTAKQRGCELFEKMNAVITAYNDARNAFHENCHRIVRELEELPNFTSEQQRPIKKLILMLGKYDLSDPHNPDYQKQLNLPNRNVTDANGNNKNLAEYVTSLYTEQKRLEIEEHAIREQLAQAEHLATLPKQVIANYSLQFAREKNADGELARALIEELELAPHDHTALHDDSALSTLNHALIGTATHHDDNTRKHVIRYLQQRENNPDLTPTTFFGELDNDEDTDSDDASTLLTRYEHRRKAIYDQYYRELRQTAILLDNSFLQLCALFLYWTPKLHLTLPFLGFILKPASRFVQPCIQLVVRLPLLAILLATTFLSPLAWLISKCLPAKKRLNNGLQKSRWETYKETLKSGWALVFGPVGKYIPGLRVGIQRSQFDFFKRIIDAADYEQLKIFLTGRQHALHHQNLSAFAYFNEGSPRDPEQRIRDFLHYMGHLTQQMNATSHRLLQEDPYHPTAKQELLRSLALHDELKALAIELGITPPIRKNKDDKTILVARDEKLSKHSFQRWSQKRAIAEKTGSKSLLVGFFGQGGLGAFGIYDEFVSPTGPQVWQHYLIPYLGMGVTLLSIPVPIIGLAIACTIIAGCLSAAAFGKPKWLAQRVGKRKLLLTIGFLSFAVFASLALTAFFPPAAAGYALVGMCFFFSAIPNFILLRNSYYKMSVDANIKSGTDAMNKTTFWRWMTRLSGIPRLVWYPPFFAQLQEKYGKDSKIYKGLKWPCRFAIFFAIGVALLLAGITSAGILSIYGAPLIAAIVGMIFIYTLTCFSGRVYIGMLSVLESFILDKDFSSTEKIWPEMLRLLFSKVLIPIVLIATFMLAFLATATIIVCPPALFIGLCATLSFVVVYSIREQLFKPENKVATAATVILFLGLAAIISCAAVGLFAVTFAAPWLAGLILLSLSIYACIAKFGKWKSANWELMTGKEKCIDFASHFGKSLLVGIVLAFATIATVAEITRWGAGLQALPNMVAAAFHTSWDVADKVGKWMSETMRWLGLPGLWLFNNLDNFDFASHQTNVFISRRKQKNTNPAFKLTAGDDMTCAQQELQYASYHTNHRAFTLDNTTADVTKLAMHAMYQPGLQQPLQTSDNGKNDTGTHAPIVKQLNMPTQTLILIGGGDNSTHMISHVSKRLKKTNVMTLTLDGFSASDVNALDLSRANLPRTRQLWIKHIDQNAIAPLAKKLNNEDSAIDCLRLDNSSAQFISQLNVSDHTSRLKTLELFDVSRTALHANLAVAANGHVNGVNQNSSSSDSDSDNSGHYQSSDNPSIQTVVLNNTGLYLEDGKNFLAKFKPNKIIFKNCDVEKIYHSLDCIVKSGQYSALTQISIEISGVTAKQLKSKPNTERTTWANKIIDLVKSEGTAEHFSNIKFDNSNAAAYLRRKEIKQQTITPSYTFLPLSTPRGPVISKLTAASRFFRYLRRFFGKITVDAKSATVLPNGNNNSSVTMNSPPLAGRDDTSDSTNLIGSIINYIAAVISSSGPNQASMDANNKQILAAELPLNGEGINCRIREDAQQHMRQEQRQRREHTEPTAAETLKQVGLFALPTAKTPKSPDNPDLAGTEDMGRHCLSWLKFKSECRALEKSSADTTEGEIPLLTTT